MVADLRKMQENQGVSENRIDKLGFSVHSYIVLFHQTSIFVLLCVDILYTFQH